MNKKIITLCFAAAIGLNSCTEVLEPKVDYGDNTYINDYSALVTAINDMSKSFGDRIDALNTLLKNGMAELKLSIDANTGAITVLSQTTQQGLSDINKTLFDGFSTLSAQIDAQGQQIVYALNANGEILRLQIDTTGKLITAQLLATGNDLIKAINTQTNTLDERFNALTAAVTAGLKEVKVSIDATTGAITLLDKNTQASLDKIDGSLTAGFKLVSETIKDGNEKIILAMNENGQLLRLQIDETGKLISAEIKAAAERLEAVINDLTATLDARFKALTDMVEAGYKAIVVSIDKNTGAIELFDQHTQESLTTINETLIKGFRKLSTQIDATGKQIITAMNENGELLRIQIDSTGKLIRAQIEASCKDIIAAINDQTKKLDTRLMNLNILMKDGVIEQLKTVNGKLQANTDAIEKINSTLAGDIKTAIDNINTTLGDIKTNTATLTGVLDYLKGIDGSTNELAEALKAMLIDNGIYFNADGKIAAISPSVYELCQTDTELKEYIKSLAVIVEAPKTLTSNNNWKFDIELISKASDLVFYMEQGTYDSKPAYLTLNIRPDATYEIKGRGGNTFKTVDIEDAMSSRRQLTSDRPLKSTTIPVVFCNAFKYVPADKVKITIN